MPEAPPDITIRPSGEADVPAMLAIYSNHISQGIGDLGAYVDEPLREEDLKQRRKSMRKKKLPHLVAEVDGMVAGRLCRAVPQAACLSLHPQAFDLYPSRLPSRRYWPPPAPGTYRRLRPGGLFPADRLYRQHQRGIAAPARNLWLPSGRPTPGDRFQIWPLDRHSVGAARAGRAGRHSRTVAGLRLGRRSGRSTLQLK